MRTTFRPAKDMYVRKFPAAPPGKFGISVAQPAQEKVLFERCVREGVEFRWSHAVEGVSTDSDGVTLQITEAGHVRARYVVAADGARSAVRQRLGIEMEGTRSKTAFVIVDLAANMDDPAYNERAFHYQHPAVAVATCLLCRLAVDFVSTSNVPNTTMWSRCRRSPSSANGSAPSAGPGFDLPPLWVTTYRFNRSVATSYTDSFARSTSWGEAAAPLSTVWWRSRI